MEGSHPSLVSYYTIFFATQAQTRTFGQTEPRPFLRFCVAPMAGFFSSRPWVSATAGASKSTAKAHCRRNYGHKWFGLPVSGRHPPVLTTGTKELEHWLYLDGLVQHPSGDFWPFWPERLRRCDPLDIFWVGSGGHRQCPAKPNWNHPGLVRQFHSFLCRGAHASKNVEECNKKHIYIYKIFETLSDFGMYIHIYIYVIDISYPICIHIDRCVCPQKLDAQTNQQPLRSGARSLMSLWRWSHAFIIEIQGNSAIWSLTWPEVRVDLENPHEN